MKRRETIVWNLSLRCDKDYHPEADGVHSVKESSVNSEESSLHIPASLLTLNP